MMKIYLMLSYVGWAWTLLVLLVLTVALRWKGRTIGADEKQH